jgi:hypothetical protein
MRKRVPDYRFLAIREPLRELDLGDAEQLPFPTMSFGTRGRYKLFGSSPTVRRPATTGSAGGARAAARARKRMR